MAQALPLPATAASSQWLDPHDFSPSSSAAALGSAIIAAASSNLLPPGLQFYTDVLKENAYPIVDPAVFPMRLPGGASGPAISLEQIAGLLKERAFVFPTTLDQQTRANAACRAVNATGDCITSLRAFESVWYSALSPNYRPGMAAFPFSDAAFARMRLTVDPLVIAAVQELPEGVDASGGGMVAGTDKPCLATEFNQQWLQVAPARWLHVCKDCGARGFAAAHVFVARRTQRSGQRQHHHMIHT